MLRNLVAILVVTFTSNKTSPKPPSSEDDDYSEEIGEEEEVKITYTPNSARANKRPSPLYFPPPIPIGQQGTAEPLVYVHRNFARRTSIGSGSVAWRAPGTNVMISANTSTRTGLVQRRDTGEWFASLQDFARAVETSHGAAPVAARLAKFGTVSSTVKLPCGTTLDVSDEFL